MFSYKNKVVLIIDFDGIQAGAVGYVTKPGANMPPSNSFVIVRVTRYRNGRRPTSIRNLEEVAFNADEVYRRLPDDTDID